MVSLRDNGNLSHALTHTEQLVSLLRSLEIDAEDGGPREAAASCLELAQRLQGKLQSLGKTKRSEPRNKARGMEGRG